MVQFCYFSTETFSWSLCPVLNSLMLKGSLMLSLGSDQTEITKSQLRAGKCGTVPAPEPCQCKRVTGVLCTVQYVSLRIDDFNSFVLK